MKQGMKKLQGFTLMELIIVMAIIGILAAVALPAYRKSTQKSNRTDARISMLRLATLEERFYFRENNYTANFADIVTGTTTTTTTTNDTVTSDNKFYSIVVTLSGGGTGWSMTATAVGTQALDTDCAKFTLTSVGAKTAKNSSNAANTACW